MNNTPKSHVSNYDTNKQKENFFTIMTRFREEYSLNHDEIIAYADSFLEIWQRERKAQNSRNYRLRNSLHAVTVTDAVTNAVTQDKEERITKENLPPTPPRREKNKKEETLTSVSVPRARAHSQIPLFHLKISN